MRRLLFVLFVFLILAVAANAQTFRGSINGTVSDPSGAFVPNAKVKATEVSTNIDHNTVTTGDGQFAFQDIPLGFYKVTVAAAGFATTTVDKVQVVAGTIYTLPVKLSIAKEVTTVEVAAAALTVDPTTSTQTQTIESQVVQDIPLNGRDFSQLIAANTGYGGYSVGGFGSLNGTRPNQMNWQIDGVDNNDFWHNIPAVNQGGVSGIAGVVLPIDAVDEFSAQTQNGAEAGRNVGGTINLVMKSGGNALHGTAYFYDRNEAYGAASPFFIASATQPKSPKLRNLNYGGSVSGPIIKDRAFYFLTFEKQQYIIGLSGLATEPSDAWITQAKAVLTNTGGFFGAYAPVTPSTLSANLIGPTGFWPRSLIGSLPATINNFFSPIASTGYSYNGTMKFDFNLTDKHRLSAHWFGGQGSQTAPLGGSPALGTASSNLKDYFEVAPIHVYNFSVILNSTFSPRLTNQVLIGVNYFNQVFHDFNNSFDTKAMGLFLSPDATIKGTPIHGAPNIAISGFEQIGLTPPEGRNDITGHLTDIVSYVVGKHQLRFGAEFRQAHVNEFYHRRGTGKFSFTGNQATSPWRLVNADGTPNTPCTTNAHCAGIDPNTRALADFLAGKVASSGIAVGDPERFVTVNAYNMYFQDQWQLTRKLNVNLGLRYEYFGPLSSDRNDIAIFVPGKGLQIPSSIFPTNHNDFAPRLGFAYQPTEKGDVVVRGFFGIFYDQINMNPFLDFRPPINGAQGIQGNPFGPFPVSTYSRGTYTWLANQQVFPGVTVCTDPFCTGKPGLNLFTVSQNFRTPHFATYSLQAEKGLGKSAVLQVGYVGNQGRKLNVVTDINQPDNVTGTVFPFPNFGSILQLNSVGTSNYNALQTSFKVRSWRGLTSTFGYTWSHALDEISEYRAAIADDASKIKRDYGNGDYDTRHLFTANITYAIPEYSRGPKFLTRGWEVTSLMNWHTGQPYDETLSGLSLVGDPFAGVSHSFSAKGGGTQWLNPAAFCAPGVGTCPTGPIVGTPGSEGSGGGLSLLGNLSRNKFYGPGYGDVDLSILKTIPIRERLKVQLRAEMFNLFNRVNLQSGPGSVPTSPCAPKGPAGRCAPVGDTTFAGFGLVSDTIGDFNGAPGIGPGEAFNMQLAIKIIF